MVKEFESMDKYAGRMYANSYEFNPPAKRPDLIIIADKFSIPCDNIAYLWWNDRTLEVVLKQSSSVVTTLTIEGEEACKVWNQYTLYAVSWDPIIDERKKNAESVMKDLRKFFLGFLWTRE
jgi:hypothetical protein